MAAADRAVRILHRQYLPGGGFTTSGAPKQGKTHTWGRISGTAYAAGGYNLVPNDVGLTVIDHADFNVIAIDGADVPAGDVTGHQLRPAAGLLELFEDASTETS